MGRYIDAEKMIADTEAMRQISEAITIDGIVKYINEHATSNVQEVVRCKDCMFRFTETCLSKHETADMDFCSCGAKMDGKKGTK